MEKINFINQTTPALNATNLNKLQDNVEDAIEETEQQSQPKDSFALLSGTSTLPMLTLSLPNGFTGENCVIVSVSYKKSGETAWKYVTTQTISSSEYTSPITVELNTSSILALISEFEEYSYKILLMKID